MSLYFRGRSPKSIWQTLVMLDAAHNRNNARLRRFPFALVACAVITASLGFGFSPARMRELPWPIARAAAGSGIRMRIASIADLFERVPIGAPVVVLR